MHGWRASLPGGGCLTGKMSCSHSLLRFRTVLPCSRRSSIRRHLPPPLQALDPHSLGLHPRCAASFFSLTCCTNTRSIPGFPLARHTTVIPAGGHFPATSSAGFCSQPPTHTPLLSCSCSTAACYTSRWMQQASRQCRLSLRLESWVSAQTLPRLNARTWAQFPSLQHACL